MERLPKLIPGYIMRYWYLMKNDGPVIPDDYPETSSVFSKEYKTEAEEIAVNTLENELKTGSSTVFPEDAVPENKEYGEFLGVYNVEANLNELTLASPKKVEPYTESAIVKHFNSETGLWEDITDVQIIDGYVYAVFTSLSPIAVITVRRKVYITEDGKFFVANGLPITISECSEGGVSITDVFGNVTNCPSTISIIGGTYNENGIVEETNIMMESGTVNAIHGGSANFMTDGQSVVKKADVTMNGGTIRGLVGGGIFRCRVEETNVSFNAGKAEFVCSGNLSFYDSSTKDCNTADADINSPSYVLNANLAIAGGEVELAYAGGSSGFGYVKDNYAKVIGGKIGYLLGPSNGNVDSLILDIDAGEIGILQSVNRGNIKKAHFDVSGGTIDKFFLGGDATDKTVTGTVNEVTAIIGGATANLYAGTNGGVKIMVNDQIIKEVTVEKSAQITYMEDFDTEFADIIKTV